MEEICPNLEEFSKFESKTLGKKNISCLWLSCFSARVRNQEFRTGKASDHLFCEQKTHKQKFEAAGVGVWEGHIIVNVRPGIKFSPGLLRQFR